LIFIRFFQDAKGVEPVRRERTDIRPGKVNVRPEVKPTISPNIRPDVRPNIRPDLANSPVFYTVEARTKGFQMDFSDRVLTFQYEDEQDKADRCEITLDNHDLSQFDNEAWRKGAILEVSWGYPGNMAPPRRVVVQKVRGGTTLSVEAHGLEMLMHKKRETKVWSGRTLKEVADEIVAVYKEVFPKGTGEIPPESMTEHMGKLEELQGKLPAPRVAAAPVTSTARNFPLIHGLAAKWAPIFGVPVQMVLTIAYIESRFRAGAKNTNERAMSRGGAWGVVQMTLFTARELATQLERSGVPQRNREVAAALSKWDGTGNSLLDPDLCLLLGVFMLGSLWARFGGDPRRVSAAYHSGSKPVLSAEKAGVDVTSKLGHYGKQYVGLTVANWPNYAPEVVGVPGVVASTPTPVLPPPVAPPQDDPGVAAASSAMAEEQEGVHGEEALLPPPPDIVPDPPSIKPNIRPNIKPAILPSKPNLASASGIKIAKAHQSGETDAEFLSRIASKYGYTFYVDHAGFHLRRIDEAYALVPSKTLTWFHGEGDWLEFDYDDDATAGRSKVQGKGVDPMSSTTYTVEGSNEATRREGVAPSTGQTMIRLTETAEAVREEVKRVQKQAATLPKGSTGDNKWARALEESSERLKDLVGDLAPNANEVGVESSSSSDPALAKAEADGQFMNRQAAEHQLTGRVIGDPAFAKQTVMMCLGISRRLSGRWKVRSVEHRIDNSGYICRFKAERDGDNGFGEQGDADTKANLNTKQQPKAMIQLNEVAEARRVWDSPSDKKEAQ
jgi:phage protein D